MDLDEKRRLCQNWRGRRLLACRAVDDLRDIIAALGAEDGSVCPPCDSRAAEVTPAVANELQNMATNLLRLILIHNDGSVSPAKPQRF